MKIIAVLILFYFATSISFARILDTVWTKTYGGSEREIGHAVCQTDDEGFIITGITESFAVGSEDIYLLKTDANGDTLWTKVYGDAEADWGLAVQQTKDDGYIVAGFTSSIGNGDNDIYLLKTDSNGDTLWTKTYGGQDDDRASSIQQTSDNGYIVMGVTASSGLGDYDLYILKTDSNGDTLWTKTYGGSEREAGYCVQQTSDNGYIFTGYTSLSPSQRVALLIKTDSQGDTLWTRIYGENSYTMGTSVNQTSDNGYIISGIKIMDGPGMNVNAYLIKTDSNGDTLWTRTYGGDYIDWASAVVQTSDGGYLLAGTLSDSPEGVFDDREANDIFVIRTDPNGDTLWTKILGGADHDAVGESSNVLDRTSDNGFIIVGSTKSPQTGNIDIWLIRLEPEIPISVKNEITAVDNFYLEQNYPNPFNPTTKIKYQIPELSFVTLKIYNVLGSEIETLVDEQKPAGIYECEFDATNLPSGIYFYLLQAGDYIITKKMVLLR